MSGCRRLQVSGALEAVTEAMVRHLKHVGVQENGCAAIGNLAVNDENQAKAGRIGSIEAVVDAMNQHLRHQGVQERGCAALRNLCGSFDNQAKVASAGGVPAVCAALQQHASHAATCERGCAALGNLTFKNPENQALAAASGGVEAVIAAMKAHAKVPLVQERGCAALGNMGFKNADNQRRITVSHGMEVIVEAISRFGDHAGVQEQGFRSLRNLALLDERDVSAAVDAPGGGAGAAQADTAVEMPTSLSGVPGALRAYVASLKRQQERGCLPLGRIVRQLDTLNVLGLKDSPGEAMSEADMLRIRVRQALERVDGNAGAVL